MPKKGQVIKPPKQATKGPKSWFGVPSVIEAMKKRKKMYEEAAKM